MLLLWYLKSSLGQGTLLPIMMISLFRFIVIQIGPVVL